jgi:class 3 adenylate cyclase
LNDAWRAQGLPAAGLRIGLHTGPVVAGCLGRGEKLEYCLLGDTANTGARIEALGKDYVRRADECIILVGAATYARLNRRFAAQPVGEIKLRGKERSVGVYRICDDAPEAMF